MKTVLVLVALVLLAACRFEPRGRCDTAADCLAGQACTSGMCVTPPNTPPTAAADAYAATEDALLDVRAVTGVLSNDTDADGDALEAALVEGPASGVLTLAADGAFRYVPAAEQSGAVTFTYRASDGRDASSAVTVTIQIAPAPDAPVALADAYVASSGATLAVLAANGLLANDGDPDGDSLTAIVETPPVHGALALDASGAFTYTSDAGYEGADGFTYRASDGALTSAATAVTLTVVLPPTAPVTAADGYTAIEDTPLIVSAPGVLANDSDANGDALASGVAAGPAHGTLALSADGSFRYVPFADYAGPDAFTYRASDGALLSTETMVAISVATVPDAPVALADAYTTATSTPLLVGTAQGVVANDTDADGDTLQAVLVSGPSHGTLSLGLTGSFTYVPTVGYSGTDAFTYRASDGTLVSGPATVTLSVVAPPSPPLAVLDAYAVDEDSSLTVPAATGVLANDSDANGDALSAVLVSGTTSGTLSLASDGSFTYVPNPNFWTTDSFTYRASDGALTSAATTVTIHVAAVNDPPVPADDTFSTAYETQLVVSARGVLENDSDLDGDVLTATLVADPANGAVSLQHDGSFVYVPDSGFSGTDSFSYTASDGTVVAGPATVTVTVRPAQQPPAASPDAYTTPQARMLSVAAPGLLANDSDPDGDPLSAVLVSGPLHGRVYLEASGAFRYVPFPSYVGGDAFTYRASDGVRQSSSVFASISVTNDNVPPLAIATALSIAPGAPLSATLRGTDADGDPLAFALVDGPRYGTATLGASGALAYTPAPGFAGGDELAFTVSDGARVSAPARVTVSVVAATNRWSADGFPASRAGHTSVWTGSELIVFGGRDRFSDVPFSARLAPATGAWTRLPAGANAPSARSGHTAVWTGTEMIVWGGTTGDFTRLENGGRFDPATGTWRAMTITGAPTKRAGHRAVWTGREMIVCGGRSSTGSSAADYPTDVKAYDPATNTWRALSTAGSPCARELHAAIWTGTELVVWGGFKAGTSLADGARYDPAMDVWTPLPATGAPSVRYEHAAVWTGSELVVWGGTSSAGYRGDGARYDPAADAWTPLPAAGAPSARFGATAVWTGDRLIVWGGSDGPGVLATGAALDLGANAWTPLASTDAPAARYGHTATWTGTEMIVFGGKAGASLEYTSSGGRYLPASDAWTPMPSNGPPPARSRTQAVWTGKELLVVGGDFTNGTAGRYDPATRTWTRFTTTLPASLERTALWTGSRFIWWGGDSSIIAGTGALYDPVTDVWSSISTVGAPAPIRGWSAVWTGTELIVWGGVTAILPSTVYSNAGARYDPATNTWRPMSQAYAPAAREAHSAVWTGTEMIVWGGRANTSACGGSYCGDGHAYDPATDTWRPISTGTNSPRLRSKHTAIWTGDRMIVWGGEGETQPGGVYDPATDTWAPITSTGAPAMRQNHPGIWTGKEMLIWGEHGPSIARNDGALYDPAANQWRTITLTDAPPPRAQPGIAWMGRLLLFGGGAGDEVWIYDP